MEGITLQDLRHEIIFQVDPRDLDNIFIRRQEFERDQAFELGILGFVHDAHAPAAELGENFVMGNGLADHFFTFKKSSGLLSIIGRKLNCFMTEIMRSLTKFSAFSYHFTLRTAQSILFCLVNPFLQQFAEQFSECSLIRSWFLI